MTHIEQMIKDMCPHGVEFKRLGEVCEMKRGKFLSKSDIYPMSEGFLPIILYGELYTTYSKHIAEIKSYAPEEIAKQGTLAKKGDLLLPISSTTKEAQIGCAADLVIDEPVYVGGDAIVLSHNQDPGFLMYYINSGLFEKEKMRCVSGTTVTHLSPTKLLQIEIPIPPLEIQKKIVECLDKFSALAAELQAELQLRRKQYEYYRTQLLTPHSDGNSATKSDDRNWEWKTLGEICYSIRTGLNPRKFFRLNTEDATNYYVTIREIQNNCIVTSEKTDRMNDEALSLIQKRSNIEKGDLLFSGTGTIGQMYVVTETPKNWGIKEGIYILKPKAECVLTKFLYYILATDYISKKINDKVAGGIVMSIPMKELMAISIPLPSLEEQTRIVAILDKFEALTTSLSDGIPAEQAAQQKRYEYYRDLLLTFPRKEV